ncbi:MAG: FAD-dependent 5-carboxymethylaminomethyl-2-thiouridine(34) oxidoreductase MnmC [Pseudomonadales bacterium]|nr:FAD-dependent 5-carboxymethylaminomethyl-2-thiouridine(34) oxidoreductase MnmC [Pseudomonadales bacterium]
MTEHSLYQWRLTHPKLDWQLGATPMASAYDDVYFSQQNALAEIDYVFIDGNNLSQRFKTAQQQGEIFTIAETGFGTGLNFLKTAQLWLNSLQTSQSAHQSQLHFISVEAHPLKPEDLQHALNFWPSLNPLSQSLIDLYPMPFKGWHTIDFAPLGINIQLSIFFGDVKAAFSEMLVNQHPSVRRHAKQSVNAWYLDGFAPAKNPAMWSDTVFELMAKLSSRNTSFATFTAAGFVKRGLKKYGFEVRKAPGFGNKRERLIGQFYGIPEISPALAASSQASKFGDFWSHYQTDDEAIISPKQSKVAIIGAGIAGLSCAFQLACSGYQVTVYESNAKAMSAASGNPEAVLFPKLSPHLSDFAQFNLNSLQYAMRHYQQLNQLSQKHHHQQPAHFCGLLQCIDADDQNQAKHLDQLFNKLCQWIPAEQASKVAGTTLHHDCLYYPKLGYIRPAELAALYLSHENIVLHTNTTVTKLSASNTITKRWRLTYTSDSSDHTATIANANAYNNADSAVKLALEKETKNEAEADIVVICNAAAAVDLLPDQTLDIKTIRGQIDQLTINSARHQALQAVICHQGYITPPRQSTAVTHQYHFGASYDLANDSAQICEQSSNYNMAKLRHYLPSFTAEAIAENKHQLGESAARVGFRCTSKDYMPITGPVPDSSSLVEQFALYRKNAKAFIPNAMKNQTGLFINIGFGSRGYTSAPYCAWIIEQYIRQSVMPIEHRLLAKLHPARFAIKQLKRNQ